MDLVALKAVLSESPVIFLLSAALAVLLSIWPGNLIVVRVDRWLVGRIAKQAKVAYDESSERDTLGAATVGCIERPIYILAIMLGQPGIITAVIILKAFFNWTFPYSEKKNGEGLVEMNVYYHAYVIGNLLSLSLALVLAEIGVHVFPALLRRFGSLCFLG